MDSQPLGNCERCGIITDWVTESEELDDKAFLLVNTAMDLEKSRDKAIDRFVDIAGEEGYLYNNFARFLIAKADLEGKPDLFLAQCSEIVLKMNNEARELRREIDETIAGCSGPVPGEVEIDGKTVVVWICNSPVFRNSSGIEPTFIDRGGEQN